MPTREELQVMIDQAVEQRENGATRTALDALETVAETADEQKEYRLSCEARIHAVICLQHLADLGIIHYIDVANKAYYGLHYSLAHQPECSDAKKHFLYRLGVARFMMQDYRKAAEYLTAAMALITEDSPEFVEFASYWGLTALLAGNENTGTKFLLKALEKFRASMALENPPYEPWHAKIIECGLCMKLAMATHATEGPADTRTDYMLKAKYLAQQLQDSGRPMRMVQYRKLAIKLNFDQ